METTSVCLCGCGRFTRRGRGGKPNRYLRGHNSSSRRPGAGSINQGHRYLSVNGKRKAYHRLVMENYLCRPLEPWEVVHHIDGKPLNNEIDNLEVMSRSDHLVLHLRQMPIEPWTEREMEVALALRSQGLPIDEVANMVGKSYFATRRRLARGRQATVQPPRRRGAEV